MADQPILQSKPVSATLMWLGFAFMSWFSFLCLQGGIKAGYLQLIPVLIGSVFVAMAGLCLGYILFGESHFKLYTDRLVIYSFVRLPIRIIYLAGNTRWEEEQILPNGLKRLEVISGKKKFGILDNEEHYQTFRQYIVGCIPNGTFVPYVPTPSSASTINWATFTPVILSFIVGGWLIFGSLRSILQPNAEFEGLQLHEIYGILSEPPLIKNESKSHYVIMHLTRYPDCGFIITGAGFEAVRLNLVDELTTGDSVVVEVDETEYKKTITHELPLTIWDKIDYSDNLYVYSLAGRGYYALSVRDYQFVNDSGTGFKISIAALGLCLILWSLYKYYNPKAPPPQP